MRNLRQTQPNATPSFHQSHHADCAKSTRKLPKPMILVGAFSCLAVFGAANNAFAQTTTTSPSTTASLLAPATSSTLVGTATSTVAPGSLSASTVVGATLPTLSATSASSTTQATLLAVPTTALSAVAPTVAAPTLAPVTLAPTPIAASPVAEPVSEELPVGGVNAGLGGAAPSTDQDLSVLTLAALGAGGLLLTLRLARRGRKPHRS